MSCCTAGSLGLKPEFGKLSTAMLLDGRNFLGMPSLNQLRDFNPPPIKMTSMDPLQTLVKFGQDKEWARKSAGNGRGEWWNAGASHMNQVIPVRLFERLGLLSLYTRMCGFQSI
jgi:hypothetical protein